MLPHRQAGPGLLLGMPPMATGSDVRGPACTDDLGNHRNRHAVEPSAAIVDKAGLRRKDAGQTCLRSPNRGHRRRQVAVGRESHPTWPCAATMWPVVLGSPREAFPQKDDQLGNTRTAPPLRRPHPNDPPAASPGFVHEPTFIAVWQVARSRGSERPWRGRWRHQACCAGRSCVSSVAP